MQRNATDDECERTIIGISEFQNIEKEQPDIKELDPKEMVIVKPQRRRSYRGLRENII
jgi:hypothetical protein